MTKPIATDILLDLYRSIARIRRVELRIEDEYHLDEMKTPVHLALGQEAVAAGVCAHLRADDYVFSNHRSHAHYLAKGGDLKAMMAEMYCRETGCARGRGGSMHLIDTSVGHLGSSAIVGGGIPHAVGAALAAVMRGEDRVAVTFFGDAASEQGVFFESMSLAALKKLPVVFVCENNRYSVCSHLSARQPNMEIAMRPRAFAIPSQRVDGMDAAAVYQQARVAVDHARSGAGPYFLECCVNRWRAHAGAGDAQGAQYRLPEDLGREGDPDPLLNLAAGLTKERGVAAGELAAIDAELDKEIAEAFDYAKASPLPRAEDLGRYLFSD